MAYPAVVLPLASIAERVRGLELETERLTVRRFREEDVPVALQHELDPQIMKYIRDPLPPEEALAKTRELLGPWSGAEGEWLGLVVTERGRTEMIGFVCFRVLAADRETLEIGYRFHPDHGGRGLASEACRALVAYLFDTVGAHKIVAYCVARNTSSYRLMERIGMRREGLLREFSKLGGVWCDELVYGMLRSDPRSDSRPPPQHNPSGVP